MTDAESPAANDTPRVPATTSGRPRMATMFESARFKLTLFYLAVILVLSLTLTLTTRLLAQHEYERSNVVQRGQFRGVIEQFYGVPRHPGDDVFGFQQQQERAVRAKLDLYLELINLGALVFGGIASYWFAGRTLRPIEEAHEAQRRFASDASHELRTPLTAIRTENEVFLRQKTITEQDARAQIQSNLEEVDRLERLATNLLSLTRYESDSLKLTRLKVKSIITEAIRQSSRSDPKIRIEDHAASGTVLGHFESLTQLLGIILDNARKYGTGKPIEISGKRVDKDYLLVVRDHGPGIADEDLPHIFKRLYRGDKARSQAVAGHGLGLALAEQIAVANKASITASNHPDGGAEFTIALMRPNRKN